MNTVERIMALREHYNLPRLTFDEMTERTPQVSMPLHYHLNILDRYATLDTTGGQIMSVSSRRPRNPVGARVSIHERHAGAEYWRGKPSIMMWLGRDAHVTD